MLESRLTSLELYRIADAAALAHSTQASAPRVAPDSNTWVDVLILDDTVMRPIRAVLEVGRLDTVISPACRKELCRVFGYPQFAHYAVDMQTTLTWVDHVTRSVTDPEGAARAQGEAFVPRYKDRDDRKFLALADTADAAYLVSKDRAVLRLKRRMVEHCDMAVLSPKQFVALVQLEDALLVVILNQA